jgi:hypothetical protein
LWRRFWAELNGDYNEMNRFERLFGLKGEARVKFLDGEFQVVSPGDFVTCAVTGEPIALPDLRYWSVELQEAYATADASLQRYREMRHKLHRD